MNGPPSRGKFYPAPIVINTKCLLTTVAMNDFALFKKNSFTYKGYLWAALAIDILQPFLIASALGKFLAFSSNCAIRRFKSGHQFSAQDNMTKNMGGPSPRAIWWVIQWLRSLVLLLQKLPPPPYISCKVIHHAWNFVFLFFSCLFSCSTVGGSFLMNRSELKEKLPSLLFVCCWIILYKDKLNILSSRSWPS